VVQVLKNTIIIKKNIILFPHTSIKFNIAFIIFVLVLS
jgi:hypothetical protein